MLDWPLIVLLCIFLLFMGICFIPSIAGAIAWLYCHWPPLHRRPWSRVNHY